MQEATDMTLSLTSILRYNRTEIQDAWLFPQSRNFVKLLHQNGDMVGHIFWTFKKEKILFCSLVLYFKLNNYNDYCTVNNFACHNKNPNYIGKFVLKFIIESFCIADRPLQYKQNAQMPVRSENLRLTVNL